MDNISDCILVSRYDTTNQTYRTATVIAGYDFKITNGWGYLCIPQNPRSGMFVFTPEASM